MKNLTNKKKYTNFFEPVGPLCILGNKRDNVLSSFRTYEWKANRFYYNIQRKQTLLQTVYQEAEQQRIRKKGKGEQSRINWNWKNSKSKENWQELFLVILQVKMPKIL